MERLKFGLTLEDPHQESEVYALIERLLKRAKRPFKHQAGCDYELLADQKAIPELRELLESKNKS